jgi:hypothetical protein
MRIRKNSPHWEEEDVMLRLMLALVAMLIVWHISDQALSARTAAIRSHHVGGDRGLVDEHQSGRVKKPLLTNPASTCPSDVGALLFRRAQAFLTVMS